jgi:NDP-sugar pyrophosphorylase family protein
VIMAGGRGRRLAPYTTVLPKPLMPLSDRPVIDVLIRQLATTPVEQIHICVGHLGSLIESWVRGEGDYGVPISFWHESEPLGTAGALATIDRLSRPFLALNGDILTTLSFSDLIDRHRQSGAVITVAVKERTLDVEYGVVHVGPDGQVVTLEEKPQLRYTVSMGAYAFDPEALRHIARGERIDFPDLLQKAVEGGDVVQVYRFDGYWRDIGNRDDYEAAIEDFAADPKLFLGLAW